MKLQDLLERAIAADDEGYAYYPIFRVDVTSRSPGAVTIRIYSEDDDSESLRFIVMGNTITPID